MQRLLAILMGVWLGAQLCVGYVVVPVLFMSLPQMTAGQMAGQLFTPMAYAGMLVWALAAYVGKRQQERSFLTSHTLAWIGLLWALLALSQWVVTPVINALKSGGDNWLLALSGQTQFALWHGIASSIYLLVSLIGVYLVFKLLRFEWH